MKYLIALALIIVTLFNIAATPRQTPYEHRVYRPTVLTSEQTEIELPSTRIAIHTTIVNRGSGTLYIKFEDGTINTSTDVYLLEGESLQNIDVPWHKLEMLAVTQSAEVMIIVTF